MKRAKYRDYQRKVLEHLVTRTDTGRALVKDLLTYCKIPKSSLSNVLGNMKKSQLVSSQNWFNKQKAVTVTEGGRQLYFGIIAEPAKYGLPYAVQDYLNHKDPKVDELFPIQRDFVSRGFLFSTDNVCAFAYPGSGKTLLAEMAMVQATSEGGRALYCTPYKALDWQKYGDFSKSFSRSGVSVAITDGDNPVKMKELEASKVIVGTYERVMGALRRNEPWLSGINLICVDEISLLADDERGSNLDLLLTLIKSRNARLRIITLSSIIGNPLDIAAWLSAKPIIENRPLTGIDIEESVVFADGNQLRFLCRDGKERNEAADGDLINYLVKKNLEARKTTLIFVGPRYKAPALAQKLKALHKQDDELVRMVLEFENSSYFEKTKLTSEACDLIRFGIAFHHAGLHKRVRRFIERLLAEGKLSTIVATGTLSHGVDFKIDSTIIDINSIESVHPLFCYEYINYKGRAGRPGKSTSASVFITCDKARAHNVFNRYFVRAPEEVIPKTALKAEGIDTIILAGAASGGGISASELTELFKGTLSACYTRRIPSFSGVLSVLSQSGFLRRTVKGYELTELGRRTNDANICPRDVLEIRKLRSKPSMRDLISVAGRIDLVLNYRTTSVRYDDPTNMLLDWIDEMPIDSIKTKYRGHWDDGDILLLGEYTAIALDKISTFLKDKRMGKQIEVLQSRLRYGVKEDLVNAGLVKLSRVVRDKARFLARALFNNGYKDLKWLRKENPSKLAKRLGMSEEEATSLIADCKRILNSTLSHGVTS